MSLFKAREWWSVHVSSGQGAEEFDQGCLCVGNIDGNNEDIQQVIIGSHAGYVRIYSPSQQDYSNENNSKEESIGSSANDLWIEYHCKAPVLQVSIGRFVSGLTTNTLAVLMPRKLSVFSLTTSAGSANHGTQWQLTQAYEHQLSRSAYNFCYGPFGQVDRDFICVQAVDATLSIFEHENFAFSRFMPDSLLPGPIVYLPQSDTFVTVSSSRQLEAYRYQVLAVAADSRTKEESQNIKLGKRVTVDWLFNVGELAVDIRAAAVSGSSNLILVLGKRHMFGVTETGKLQFTHRMDYSPMALFVYGDTVHEFSQVRYMIATSGGQLLIYKGTHLLWAARMTRPIVDFTVSNFRGLKGGISTLDEFGQINCLYLGTDPSLNILPPAHQIRELNYEEQDDEMLKMQQRIKQASGASTTLMPGPKNENDLKIQVQLPQGLDGHSVSTVQLSEGAISPSYTVTLVLKPRAPLNSVQLHIETRAPFAVNQKHFSFSYVDNNQPTECSVSFFVSSLMIAFDFQVTIIATYLSINGSPRISLTNFTLPLNLGVQPCMPVKQAAYKLTVDTNQPPANLNIIFSDLLCDGGDPQGCALGFQYVGNDNQVTLLASKTSQRYRLQSDSFAALGPMVRELTTRLGQHFGSGFQCTFNDPLPLVDYFSVLDAHWQTRLNLIETQKILAERATQFRAIQRRLLTRFKDKTPQPLGNLDTLLEGSIRQLIQLSDMSEQAKQKVEAVGCELASTSRLIVHLIHLTKPLPPDELTILSNVLSGATLDSPDIGMEEIMDAGLTHMLRTVLSKTPKDVQLTSTPLERPSDISRLKKHIQMLCEKIGRGVQLTSSTSQQQPSKSFQPVSISESNSSTNDSSSLLGENGTLNPVLTDFRSPRSEEQKNKNKKKKSHKRNKDGENDIFDNNHSGTPFGDGSNTDDKLNQLSSGKGLGDFILFPEPEGDISEASNFFA